MDRGLDRGSHDVMAEVPVIGVPSLRDKTKKKVTGELDAAIVRAKYDVKWDELKTIVASEGIHSSNRTNYGHTWVLLSQFCLKRNYMGKPRSDADAEATLLHQMLIKEAKKNKLELSFTDRFEKPSSLTFDDCVVTVKVIGITKVV